MSYTAPIGNELSFVFSDSSYSPPLRNEIVFNFADNAVDCSGFSVTVGALIQNPEEAIVGLIGMTAEFESGVTSVIHVGEIGLTFDLNEQSVFSLVGVTDCSGLNVEIGITNSIFDTVTSGSVGVTVQADSGLQTGIDAADIPVEVFSESGIFEFNKDNASPIYIFTLTGRNDGLSDAEIPISSFQAKLRSGASTFLSVVVPGLSRAADINNRPNGELKIDVAYKLKDEIIQRKEIIRTQFDLATIYDGPSSKSIILTGYKTTEYETKEIYLKDSTYRSLGSTKLYRFVKPNVDLNPGDTVIVSDDSFIANTITYYVTATSGSVTTQMEISE